MSRQDGSSFRLGGRGPPIPFADPALVLVTQSSEVHLCYYKSNSPALKVLRCSLTDSSSMGEAEIKPASNIDTWSNVLCASGADVCVDATVALAYGGLCCFGMFRVVSAHHLVTAILQRHLYLSHFVLDWFLAPFVGEPR